MNTSDISAGPVPNAAIDTQCLSIGYGQRVLERGLSLSLLAGELTCLIGINGVGKSTLLRSLAGLQAPLGGQVYWGGVPLDQLSTTQRAKHMAWVSTARLGGNGMSVYELVAMGRYPYTNWWGRHTTQDHQQVSQAMVLTETTHLIDRPIQTLSDGEHQKVMIARALAQDTPVLMLDEPTAHLDLANRVMLLQLLRRLAHEQQKAILLTTHDLSLALQAADKLWLMQPEQKLITGIPEDLVLQGVFERIFARQGIDFDPQTGLFKMPTTQRRKIGLLGEEGISLHWTRQALERRGFEVSVQQQEAVCVQLHTLGQQPQWVTKTHNNQQTHYSLAEVIAEVEAL
ncbi:ABC transporter ATP-binding protein [Eisenibacter elegans]|uniref:ABC transporter ATP-binding protein n=1 Tax=Eisenibacter elegans TaxID=997 RepID=UPI000416D189|nr:ABC transporter ATP-binding protein [Eisenibacter elegans]